MLNNVIISLLVSSITSIVIIFVENGINDNSISLASTQMNQFQQDVTQNIEKQIDLLLIQDVSELRKRVSKLEQVEFGEEYKSEVDLANEIIEHFEITNTEDFGNKQQEIQDYLVEKYQDGEEIDKINEAIDFQVKQDSEYEYEGYHVTDEDLIAEYQEEINKALEENISW